MDTRVREGRTALAITILLVATLTVPALLFGNGAFGLAQAQQSPSPTGTAPSIQLVNPSDYDAKPVISDKDNNHANDSSGDDPADERYHFNAWTRNAPNNATVEFFITQNSNTYALGQAVNLGNGVYELYTALPAGLTDDSDATVRAVLLSGGELARDEQTVFVNQENNDPAFPPGDTLMQEEFRATRAAETVEIRYPVNAGPAGFFGRPGALKAIHIEVTYSERTGQAGAGPEDLRAFYTTSFRGTDPDWKQCAQETKTQSQDGIRCELKEGDAAESVTGIAVVTRDDEQGPTGVGGNGATETSNSGDAHVVTGYTQTPSAVTLTEPNVATIPGCSPLITVTVKDEIGRKIVGAPLDVHAQGPSDSLAFNTETSEQSQTTATSPDRSDPPENHPTEAGRQCDDGTVSAQLQGEHDESGDLPDRKHIESTDGTDSAGTFTFRLWNNTPGATTNTAWVDMDDNDLRCATEASGNGIVNWGTGGPAAPLPSNPDQQVCASSASASASSGSASSGSTSPSASSSTSASASTSPSASASRSTSPSASASTSPSASSSSASPSASASTTGTTSPTAGTTSTSPQKASVEVSLEASKPRVTFGKSFTLSGTVTSSNSACTDLVTVRILRDVVGGEDEFEPWAQEQTDTNGAFSVGDRGDRSASYVAQVTETATCEDATSSPQTVLVKVKVSLNLSQTNVRPGTRVRFRIKTAPCPATARDKVLLFRAIEGEFGKSGRARSSKTCAATIVRRVNKSAVFQARWPKQSPHFLTGKSRSKAVRVSD